MNIISPQHLSNIKREILNWKKINNVPNIVRILDYEIGNESVNILMELCTEGSLLDYINNYKGSISEREALFIIKNICTGLYGMHSQNPPISHRDIKIENVLKFGQNYKLCDFGSASSDTMNPRNETKQSLLEKFEVYERTTTFIYRPPEMCDEYCGYIVNEKVDVWAVGCILYTILFKTHPFQDAQKLTITTAHYYIPKEARNYSPKIIDFIRLLLTPNPAYRPNVKNILGYIQNWDNIRDIQLSPEVIEIKNKQIKNLNERLSNSSKEVSAEDLQKAKEAILKDMKKKKKYIKNNDDDINDLFDDGDEYYKVHPERREINENRSKHVQQYQYSNNYNNQNIHQNQNNNNQSNQVLLDFNSGFNNPPQQHSNNNQQLQNNFGFNFDSHQNAQQNQNNFDFDQYFKNNNNTSNQNNFGFNFDENFKQNQQNPPQQKSFNQYQPLGNNSMGGQYRNQQQPQNNGSQNILNFFQ